MKPGDVLTATAGRIVAEASELVRLVEELQAKQQQLAERVLPTFRADLEVVGPALISFHALSTAQRSLKDLETELQKRVARWQAAQGGRPA